MTPNRRTFLKQVGLSSAALSLVTFLPGCQTSHSLSTYGLPRSTPEAEGVSSAGLLAFFDALEKSKHELHSFMLVRHGKVIAEGWWTPYGPEFKHTMYSMSKSFTSTAVGLAVAEKRLTVEDPVTKFFPQDLPPSISENLAALRVKHLLTMSVGHEKDPTGPVVATENWVKTFLATPITKPPGTLFVYNSVATYMLSAIVQKITGQKIVDYLTPRLFTPLGIEGATWETCPLGINTGGWGLSVPTEALAKFGQLYLQKGHWKGRQLLSEKWVNEATTFKIQQPLPAKPARPNSQNDWLQGYCYQFWRCQHNGFRGDGAFGQYTIVLPEKDTVIIMTGESSNMQGELDLVWEHLLPALKLKALPANLLTQARLQQTLTSLALPVPVGASTSSALNRVAGKTYQIEPNALGLESVSFAFTKNACTVTFKDAQQTYPVLCGLSDWQRGETTLPGTPPRLISGGMPKRGTPAKVAARGAWKNDTTFEMAWRYYETPHHDTVTCQFDGDKVTVAFVNSIVQMRNAKDSRPLLIGQRPT